MPVSGSEVSVPIVSPIFGSKPKSNVHAGFSNTPSSDTNSWTLISPIVSSSGLRVAVVQVDPRPAGNSSTQVLRLEHEVLEERLVLDVRLVLGRAPVAALALAHVAAVLRRA